MKSNKAMKITVVLASKGSIAKRYRGIKEVTYPYDPHTVCMDSTFSHFLPNPDQRPILVFHSGREIIVDKIFGLEFENGEKVECERGWR